MLSLNAEILCIEAARNSVQVSSSSKGRSGAFAPAVIDLTHNQLWVFTQPAKNNYLNKRELTVGNINSVAFPDLAIEVSKLLPSK